MKPAALLLLATAAALRADTFTVTNANSSGAGSLAGALLEASLLPAGTAVLIEFDPVFFAEPRLIRGKRGQCA